MPATMMLEQIACYPVEDRVMMADAIIESLNGIDPNVDAAWGAIARRRMRELRSGKVRGIPVSEVFSHARKSQRESLFSYSQPTMRGEIVKHYSAAVKGDGNTIFAFAAFAVGNRIKKPSPGRIVQVPLEIASSASQSPSSVGSYL